MLKCPFRPVITEYNLYFTIKFVNLLMVLCEAYTQVHSMLIKGMHIIIRIGLLFRGLTVYDCSMNNMSYVFHIKISEMFYLVLHQISSISIMKITITCQKYFCSWLILDVANVTLTNYIIA